MRSISVKYLFTISLVSAESFTNMASNVPLSNATEKLSSGNDILVASILMNFISGRVFVFRSIIFFTATDEMSMLVISRNPVSYISILSFELPQPSINILSTGFIYLCIWSQSSTYSPYLTKLQNKQIRKTGHGSCAYSINRKYVQLPFKSLFTAFFEKLIPVICLRKFFARSWKQIHCQVLLN